MSNTQYKHKYIIIYENYIYLDYKLNNIYETVTVKLEAWLKKLGINNLSVNNIYQLNNT